MDYFLEELRREGHIDGDGVFTLDVRSRCRKFALFLQQTPDLYALKLIQAAVALGAAAVEVTQNSERIDFRFTLPELDLIQLESNLVSGHSMNGRGLQHLELALTLAHGAEGRGFEFKAQKPGQCLTAKPEQGGWNVARDCAEQPEKRGVDCLFTFFLLSTSWWKVTACILQGQRLVNLLVRSFQFCSVPIIHNGLILNTGDLDGVIRLLYFGHSSYPQGLSKLGLSLRKVINNGSSAGMQMLECHWLRADVKWGDSSPRIAISPPMTRSALYYGSQSYPALDDTVKRPTVLSSSFSFQELLVKRFSGVMLSSLADPVSKWLKREQAVLLRVTDYGGLLKNSIEALAIRLPAGHLCSRQQTVTALISQRIESFRLTGGAIQAARFLGVGAFPADPCRLFVVHDGLLMNPIEIDGPAGCMALVASDGVTSDLSQLGLSESTESIKICGWAGQALWKLVSKQPWNLRGAPEQCRQEWRAYLSQIKVPKVANEGSDVVKARGSDLRTGSRRSRSNN